MVRISLSLALLIHLSEMYEKFDVFYNCQNTKEHFLEHFLLILDMIPKLS